MSYNINKL